PIVGWLRECGWRRPCCQSGPNRMRGIFHRWKKMAYSLSKLQIYCTLLWYHEGEFEKGQTNMKRQPALLEYEDVTTRANQAAILFVMAKYGLKTEDFSSKNCWIHEGLNVPSMGIYKDGNESRRHEEDRVLYSWGRYELL